MVIIQIIFQMICTAAQSNHSHYNRDILSHGIAQISNDQIKFTLPYFFAEYYC